MSNGTPTSGMVDTWARVVTTVGFPVVAASVLIYVLVVQLIPATQTLVSQAQMQIEAHRQQDEKIAEITTMVRAMNTVAIDTQDLCQKSLDITQSRSHQIAEILSRLRMPMGEDPWNPKTAGAPQ